MCLRVCNGQAVSEPYYSQRAQCLRLSERFFSLPLRSTKAETPTFEHLCSPRHGTLHYLPAYACTHCTYPRMDGQAELTRVASSMPIRSSIQALTGLDVWRDFADRDHYAKPTFLPYTYVILKNHLCIHVLYIVSLYLVELTRS